MAAYNYINSQGVIVADTSQTKSEVESEYREIFGDDIDLSDGSPEGALVNSETLARQGLSQNNALLANQINPNLASDVFLDAIWQLTSALTGVRRKATRSTFNQPVDLTGVAGTFIPANSVAITANGDGFQSVNDVVLDESGQGSTQFISIEFGEVPCAVGELNSIASGSPLGWETVNNTVAATLGQDEESNEQSRIRRRNTLFLQGVSLTGATISALYNVSGVKSVSYRENFTDTDQTIDGIFLLKNSIYACVDGGLDEDIAQALLNNKSSGCNWNGGVTVNVTEDTSNQSYPVKFDRPSEINIWIRVTIAPTTVSDPSSVVRDSVLRYANGLIDGEEGFIVSASGSPFEIAGAINSDTPTIFVRKVEVSDDGVSYSSDELIIELDEVLRTNSGLITVNIA